MSGGVHVKRSVQGISGSQGAAGSSVVILGSVTTYTNLPGYPTSYVGNAGDGYITQDTGHLWVWSGVDWDDVGNVTGPQGIQGIQGVVGYTGTQGATGIQGNLGIQGGAGAQGIQGASGIQGADGIQGAGGVQGTTGVQGAGGIQGYTGNTGIQGAFGAQGIQGTTGAVGSQGLTGIQGTNGIQGFVGIQGALGNTGSQGVQGILGATGPQGANGIQGSEGLSGLQGTQGAQGYTGVTGIQGANGLQGIQGTSGNNGIQGVQGILGATGAQGIQGIQGMQGIQGLQGTQGIQGLNGISTGAIYYFNQSQASGVAPYKVLTTIPNGVQQIVTVNLTGSQTNALVSQFLTPELGFAVIPGGVQRFHFHFLKPASNDNIEAYATIQLADSTGTPYGPVIPTGTELIDWVDATTPDEVTTDITLPTTGISPTDRMIVKIYISNLDSTAHTVKWYTEGNQYYSFVLTSVGVIGNEGAQGATGSQGPTGSQGVTGTGTQGVQGVQGPSGGGGGGGGTIYKLTAQTLTAASWTLSGSYYIYTFSNVNITVNTRVDFTPDNASYSEVTTCGMLPEVDAAAGSCTFYSLFPPQNDITGEITIIPIV